MTNSRPVYSSDQGRLCPGCGKARNACVCRKQEKPPVGDGIVRVQRETKGRGGKTVTVVRGLSFDEDQLKVLAGELKKRCGTGGTVRDWTIEIQGDHADLLVAELTRRGYKTKRAGG
ncbi:translation initiation factor Sui1 [Geoalkalibacter sp.]|jgi:translation initiation factor 1|uniref:translation initiation factor Sui1 n=1 Tax=Geoalkalibacter sp. TaxID=3041440 RepID=UPI00272ED2C5|nr:translation initiation factor Sui1 [Geoalkalibacter sp.]